VQDEIFMGHRDPLFEEQRIALRMMIVNRPSAVARQPDCGGTAGVTIALFARGSIQGAMASPPDTASLAAASLESQIRDVAAVAREQDRGAFARLFAHFAPRVKGYLLRLGAERAQAEDLMQEVMLTVWRKAPAYDPKLASPSTWIFAIARNRRIDALRRDKRTALDPSDPGLLPEADLLPDRALDAGAWERRLAGAIGGLPPEQAQMLRLAYYEDRSHGDIAASLRLPLGTVKSRLRLAIARLRTMFETDA
jgi:RNA polymerase sigma-70 factor (ECF subfamily)